MKVYIGPYTPWWVSRIHKNYMDKKYDYDWDESTTTFERVLEKLENSLTWLYRNTANRIFGKMKRKIKIKVHDYDIWGLDNTLAHIILPSLKLLKVEKHGTPHTDREDAPADPIYDDEPTEHEWDSGYSVKRWEYIIDEMIHTFECEVDEGWEDQFHTGVIDHISVPEVVGGRTYYRMEKGPNYTHVFDAEGHKKAWERRQNGLRLFAKYYHSLWD